ncbi:MAG: bifunctional folylpolyglutamate synthase/dihydrofolate synthase, partial [Woeseiaceae bacterium]
DLPQTVLHVAGTNGKGSTVAMAQAVLTAGGSVTGCYTSPHVVHYNERITIDGLPANDADIVAAFERVEAVRNDTPLTYFEFGTLAALSVFEAHEVDVAVLEVGMGGRLDAVNAVEPTAGVITNVSLDHCEWLGEDVESIAFEKAGIMRTGKPIVIAAPDFPDALVQHAMETGADLIVAGRDYDWESAGRAWRWRGRDCELVHLDAPPLAGEFQLANAAGALALLESAGFGTLLTQSCVNAAFENVTLPGRMQRFDDGRHWLLDVAHNPAAAGVLATEMAVDEGSARTVAIVGMLDDKPVEAVIAPLAELVDDWIATTADSTRAIEADELARRIANAMDKGCLIAGSLEQAMDRARTITHEHDCVLVTGSFYIVGPALGALGLYSRGLGRS